MDEVRVDKWNTSHSLTSALTSTLTTESPINRAFQAESEGVRVIIQKLFFIRTKPGLGLVRALWFFGGCSVLAHPQVMIIYVVWNLYIRWIRNSI